MRRFSFFSSEPELVWANSRVTGDLIRHDVPYWLGRFLFKHHVVILSGFVCWFWITIYVLISFKFNFILRLYNHVCYGDRNIRQSKQPNRVIGKYRLNCVTSPWPSIIRIYYYRSFLYWMVFDVLWIIHISLIYLCFMSPKIDSDTINIKII